MEYKHGKLRAEEEYEVQLCAQAMCLEEMFGTVIQEGAIFYSSSHRRLSVKLTAQLRERVLKLIQSLESVRASFAARSAALSRTAEALSGFARQLQNCDDVDSMRGIEGAAASVYFSSMDDMLSAGHGFVFERRSKRPPENEVNAVLSFLYTQLAHDYCAAMECVGLDPAAGFLHTLRPGRASFALDLMEELRAPLCDRLTIALFNRGQLSGKDFEDRRPAVYLNEKGRRLVLSQWRLRKQEEILHPFLKEKIRIGLIPYVQAMLFARVLRGDLDRYPPFAWR